MKQRTLTFPEIGLIAGTRVALGSKSHPPSLKAKVAVEAIKAHKTTAQIAQMFGVHPVEPERTFQNSPTGGLTAVLASAVSDVG